MTVYKPKYVPILKSKMGEFGALSELPISLEGSLLPLFDVVRAPLDKRDRPIEEHLDKIAIKIAKHWAPSMPFFLDLTDISLDRRTSDGRHPLEYLSEILSEAGFRFVPSAGLDRDSEYLSATRTASKMSGQALIRLLRIDLEDPRNLGSKLIALKEALSLELGYLHVLIDLRSILEEDATYCTGLAIKTLQILSKIGNFASVIVAGSSVPQSLSSVMKADSTMRLRRHEFDLWKLTQATSATGQPVAYGDYGVVHPDQLDVDPKKLTLGASIRYTSADDILVIRGRAFKTHPEGYKQFHSLSESLVAMPEYRGVGFSWGDARISDCANRRCKSGNLTTWVKVGTSHHIAVVLDQLGVTAAIPPSATGS